MDDRLELGPWRDVPCPSDGGPGLSAVWNMAREGARQHPLAVRVLWADYQVVALGGVVQTAPEEGYAFSWTAGPLTRAAWKLVLPTVLSITHWGHDRGLRVINAVVVADHAAGHRLIRHLGYDPWGTAPGFAGAAVPMLRYLHIRPAIEEPALVRHQRHELWLACLAHWCPAYHAEIMKRAG